MPTSIGTQIFDIHILKGGETIYTVHTIVAERKEKIIYLFSFQMYIFLKIKS